MSLVLDDVIVILVVVKRAVDDDMSLLSAQFTLPLWTDRLIVIRSCPVAVRAMVVGTVFPNVIPRSALKAREIGTANWTWGRGVWCRIVASQGVYINQILPSFCCIGCCSHCLCV